LEAAELKDKKKARKTVKSFTDLPSAYVSASGVVAAPLPEWNPDYLVPPPPLESGVVHACAEQERLLTNECSCRRRNIATKTQRQEEEGK